MDHPSNSARQGEAPSLPTHLQPHVLATLFAGSLEGICVIDRDGNTLYVNPRLAQMLGYAPAELLGTSHIALPGAEARAHAPVKQTQLWQKAGRHEARLLRKDGTAMPARVSTNPLYGHDGRRVGALAIITEIAESQQVEAGPGQLQAAAEQLVVTTHEPEAAEEVKAALAARDELLAGAAHELMTPITSLRTSVQLALQRLQREGRVDPERLERTLAIIDHQSERLARLAQLLIDVADLDAGRLQLHPVETDIAGLVRHTIERARRRGGRTIEGRVPEALPATEDGRRIEQVLYGLLDNALRFTEEGTPIEVELMATDEGELRLTVRDHGPGIPPERRPGLFGRYYQAAERPFAGMGLGLYYSRTIVELHGGHIQVEFPEDGGTRFVITLPRGLGRVGPGQRRRARILSRAAQPRETGSELYPGLRDRELVVMQALVALGEGTVEKVAREARLPRPLVYPILQHLVALSHVLRVAGEGDAIYRPVGRPLGA